VGVLAPARSTNCTTTIEPLHQCGCTSPRRQRAAETGSDTPRWSQTKEELAALIRQVVTHEALAGLELRPTCSVACWLTKVSVELIKIRAAIDRPRLKQLLLDHGIPSVSSWRSWPQRRHSAGLVDPRVVVEGSKVEIALRTPVTWPSRCSKSSAAGVDPETPWWCSMD